MKFKKPHFYYSDLDNYNEEYLKVIILYHKDVINKIKNIVGHCKDTDTKKENNKGFKVLEYLNKERL